MEFWAIDMNHINEILERQRKERLAKLAGTQIRMNSLKRKMENTERRIKEVLEKEQ